MDMQDAWNTAKPEWLIWIANRKGVLTDKELRLSAVNSARMVQHMMSDDRSIAAIDVAERHANGLATDYEFAAASYSAWSAARNAASYSAWSAASAASIAGARYAANAAARYAANAAASYAADAAASYAAWDAIAEWIRENTKPDFE